MSTGRITSRRGRPKKLDQKAIENILCATQRSSSLSWDELFNHLGIENVHFQTVRNCLVNEGYCKSLDCQQLWLTLEARHARLEFAASYKDWRTEWRSVLFAAIAKFGLSPNGQPRADVSKDQQRCIHCQQDKKGGSSYGLQFWVAVGFNQRDPLLFPAENDPSNPLSAGALALDQSFGESAANKSYLLLEGNFTQATTNREKLAVPKLGKRDYEIIHFPPCSYDLNVAQDVLLFLKKRIQKARFSDLDDLKSGILKEWDYVSVRRVNKLVNSMPTRLADVVKRDGRAI